MTVTACRQAKVCLFPFCEDSACPLTKYEKVHSWVWLHPGLTAEELALDLGYTVSSVKDLICRNVASGALRREKNAEGTITLHANDEAVVCGTRKIRTERNR